MKFFYSLTLSIFLLFSLVVISQAQPTWESRLDGRVAFYQTTDFGIVLTGTENSLYAVDGQTGERIWRKQTRGLNETSVTPIPSTDLILISTDEGKKSRLEAVDVLTGESIWQSEKVKGDVLQLAVEPEADLIATVLVKDVRGKAGEKLKRKPVVHVFQLSTGDELWKKDFDNEIEMMPSRFGENLGEISFTLDNYRAPLILDGRLFLFYEGATSYDARTGKEKNREKFKINEDGLALTEADPIFDDKFVYTSGRGKVRAVNRRSGEIEWEAKDLGVTPEMAIVGDVLYVRTGGQFTRIEDGETVEKGSFGVSAIDTKNGKILWRYKGADRGLTNFVFSDANTILIADKDDLISIDAGNGKRVGKIKHDIERAQFVLINERGDAVVGGRDEIAGFGVSGLRSQVSRQSEFRPVKFNSQDEKQLETLDLRPETKALWRIKHKAPSRGILRTVAGIALRATALYFRYGGLATSALNLARGGLSLAQTVNSFRWSGLRNRFSSVDLTTLASNQAKNYVSRQIRVYGIASRTPNFLNRVNGLQISAPTLPTTSNIRAKIIGKVIDKATPTRGEVRENLLERLDPIRRVEKLSDYFLRRKRLAELRGNYMYFYTDLTKPFDKKGLVGVNVHTGKDARFILISEPDAEFVTDETVGLLYSTNANRLQAFEFLQR
jgi:outer membrane protein assembly factor BamB